MLADSGASGSGAIAGGLPAPDAIVSIDPGKVLDAGRRRSGAAADRADRLAGGTVAALWPRSGEDATLRPARCTRSRRGATSSGSAVRSAAEAILVARGRDRRRAVRSAGSASITRPDLAELRRARSRRSTRRRGRGGLARPTTSGRSAALARALGATTPCSRRCCSTTLGAAAIGEAVDHLAALTGSGLDDERRAQERSSPAWPRRWPRPVAPRSPSSRRGRPGCGDARRSAARRARRSCSSAPTVFDADVPGRRRRPARRSSRPALAVDDGGLGRAGSRRRRARRPRLDDARAAGPGPQPDRRAPGCCSTPTCERLLVDTPYRDGGAALAARARRRHRSGARRSRCAPSRRSPSSPGSPTA